VKIEKSSLAAALLELGEENAAVLLIRAPLPELLDTEHDMPALTRLGLDAEAIAELVATAAELLPTDAERGQQFQQTISRRCAKLVDQWTSSTTLRRARGATHS
jgi:thioesterase domain-containing protein